MLWLCKWVNHIWWAIWVKWRRLWQYRVFWLTFVSGLLSGFKSFMMVFSTEEPEQGSKYSWQGYHNKVHSRQMHAFIHFLQFTNVFSYTVTWIVLAKSSNTWFPGVTTHPSSSHYEKGGINQRRPLSSPKHIANRWYTNFDHQYLLVESHIQQMKISVGLCKFDESSGLPSAYNIYISMEK